MHLILIEQIGLPIQSVGESGIHPPRARSNALMKCNRELFGSGLLSMGVKSRCFSCRATFPAELHSLLNLNEQLNAPFKEHLIKS